MSVDLQSIKFGVGPYDDGSGFRHTVQVCMEKGEREIVFGEHSYTIRAADWPELRQAIDQAVEFKFYLKNR